MPIFIVNGEKIVIRYGDILCEASKDELFHVSFVLEMLFAEMEKLGKIFIPIVQRLTHEDKVDIPKLTKGE